MELLDPTERNPMNCSTLGTGIQIVHAMNRGAKSIYVGLGGSATNDGGTGIAKAMGYKFLNSDDRELQPLGKNLRQIERIELTEATRQLKEISLYAINDVNNPLYGEQGAAYVYATQKGAGEEEIVLLDEGLRQLDKVMQGQFNISIANEPGAGAAGGTAYGLKAFAKASFISGIDFMLQLAGVEDLLRKHPINYIITGEGRIDEQTLNGKLISGVVRLGKEHDIPVMAVCGKLEISRASLKDEGLYEVLEVREKTKSLEYNMENAFRLVEKSICEFFLNKL
jgi:glycerate kinase